MPATTKQKVNALQGLLGDDRLVAEVLLSAGATQKELEELGVEFKEADAPGDAQVADAAGAETPPEAVAPPEAEKDAEPAPEADSQPPGAGADSATAEPGAAEAAVSEKADKPATDDGESADEPPEMEEEEGEESEDVFLSDLTVDEFAEMLAGALDEVFGPYFDKLDAIAAASERAAPAPAAPAPAAAAKEAGVDVDALQAELTTLKEQKAALDEVISALPKALKLGAYKASEATDTVVPDDSTLLNAMPKPDDGIKDFISSFVVGNSQVR
jgi:hypothetical protein